MTNHRAVCLPYRNVVQGGPSIRKPGTFRSNLELTNSLRANILAAQEDYACAAYPNGNGNGNGNGHNRFQPLNAEIINGNSSQPNGHDLKKNGIKNGAKKNGDDNNNTAGAARPALEAWTAREGSTLYVPRIDWSAAGLQEDRSQYEITAKLFYLPTAPSSTAARAAHAREALDLVRRELGGSRIEDVDLLIVSFPGISFEGDCEWEADKLNAKMGDGEAEAATWAAAIAPLRAEGRARRLGVAEFGSEKLRRFLDDPRVRDHSASARPAVDQINVRNCCSVPPPLTDLARAEGIELLTHSDCTDVLPSGTLRELLGQGPGGAGVLADTDTDTDEGVVGGPGLRGDLVPQWVIKYTAVVRDRGVIENKGYFAGAELVEKNL